MGAWQAHYKRAALIDMGVGDITAVENRACGDAARRDWTFDRVADDLVLIRRLLNGDIRCHIPLPRNFSPPLA